MLLRSASQNFRYSKHCIKFRSLERHINLASSFIDMNQKPPYKPLDQKPYCCVPTCITMVLDRRKISHGSQDEIGYELGLTVPKEKAHLYTKVRTVKKPIAGWGTQVNKKQYSINSFFKKNKIGLKETYFFVKDISGVREFIISNIKSNKDIIVCFNNKKLHGRGDWGHVSRSEEHTSELQSH